MVLSLISRKDRRRRDNLGSSIGHSVGRTTSVPLFINDLRNNINLGIRLFASDCVIYRDVQSEQADLGTEGVGISCTELQRIRRDAARFVFSEYRQRASPSMLIAQLEWSSFSRPARLTKLHTACYAT